MYSATSKAHNWSDLQCRVHPAQTEVGGAMVKGSFGRLYLSLYLTNIGGIIIRDLHVVLLLI